MLRLVGEIRAEQHGDSKASDGPCIAMIGPTVRHFEQINVLELEGAHDEY